MKKEEIQDLTVEDVLFWIMLNRDKTEAIDEVNKATFAYTSHYNKHKRFPPLTTKRELPHD